MTLIERSSAAQHKWESLDYRTIISSMSARLGNISPETALLIKDDILTARRVMKAINLPGPTGESNMLTFHARGVLVIISEGNLDLLTHQVIKSITTGNSVVICGAKDMPAKLSNLLQLLHDAGVPKDLISFAPQGLEHNILKSGIDIDGVVTDGAKRIEIAKNLCLREGPILPVLSVNDDVERFILERTKTIDTTAAGGNVSLLAM